MDWDPDDEEAISPFLYWWKHPYRGSASTTCEQCGKRYRIGQSPFCRDNHEEVS